MHRRHLVYLFMYKRLLEREREEREEIIKVSINDPGDVLNQDASRYPGRCETIKKSAERVPRVISARLRSNQETKSELEIAANCLFNLTVSRCRRPLT